MSEQPLSTHSIDAVSPAASPHGPNGERARDAGLQLSPPAVIPTKVVPPSLGDSVLTRPRLIGWLDQQRRSRLVLVSAEAGYGKSTLLSDYSERTEAICLWYRLETSDGDWITFLSHVVAAFRREFPDFGRQTEALLHHVAAMGPSRQVVLSTFLADLGSLGNADLILILDDYHLVAGSDDVPVIMGRVLEAAPETMRFVLSARGRPELPLGRLVAQGRVAELTTNDLRFTRSEIEDLFESRYGQPLSRETCDIVEERTEGWAASLQLVSASIAASRPSEVAAFISALSGARGPIYDFLAEEVLTRLSAVTQRVLIHSSLLDRVTPDLVSAAMAATREPVASDEVEARIREIEALGLVNKDADSSGMRLHPLLRQFLAHHLASETSTDEIEAMHVAIARHAEDVDWLLAGRHYALGRQADEAMRVLGGAATEALGTGAWGAAAEVIASMPDTPPPPAAEVLRARALLDDGKSQRAREILSAFNERELGSTDRALLLLTRAAALHAEGESAHLAEAIKAVAQDESVPFPLRQVALAWEQMLEANAGGPIARASQALDNLQGDLLQAGLHYYAGVTLHNLANTELARGRYDNAQKTAERAATELLKSDDAGGVLASTRVISAAALAESGDIAKGLEAARAAIAGSYANADAVAETAHLFAVIGNTRESWSALRRLGRDDVRGARELSSRAQVCYAHAAFAMGQGDLKAAASTLQSVATISSPDIDAVSRHAVLHATLALMNEVSDSVQFAEDAIAAAEAQGAWRWTIRARILEAIAKEDADGLALWIAEAQRGSALAIPELADPITRSLSLLDSSPQLLDASILQAPNRWLPALKREIQRDPRSSSGLAAKLLSRFGSMDDASALLSYERAGARGRRRGLLTQLIRRVSPTVRIHDLGPSSYEIGDRRIVLSECRRKVAALLLYLVTCSGLTAGREQVMETLWPDQSPKSALNSLHQTLFFLRRDIEPWYEEGTSANYVRMESDLVFLDGDLFQVDSAAFMRQSADIMSSRTAAVRGPELLKLYGGHFAPEFAYEDWAEEWRGQLHASFLHLARSTGEALLKQGRVADAIEVLSPATYVEPLAFELRSMLIGALAAEGSADAARAHYRSMATLHERDLGLPASSYDEIVASVEAMT